LPIDLLCNSCGLSNVYELIWTVFVDIAGRIDSLSSSAVKSIIGQFVLLNAIGLTMLCVRCCACRVLNRNESTTRGIIAAWVSCGIYITIDLFTAYDELTWTSMQCEQPHCNTWVQNSLSIIRPSFAAANQVMTLTHVTNERVVTRRVTGSKCCRSVQFSSSAANRP